MNIIASRRMDAPRRTSRANYSSEPIIPGAERVEALRVLGVTLNSRLVMGDHIDSIIITRASSRFAIRMKSYSSQNLRLFDDMQKYHSCHRRNCDLQ